MRIPRTIRRGASAVFMVLLIAASAAAGLVAWHVVDDADRQRQRNVELGRLFGTWLQVAHAATMRNDYRPGLTADPDGFAVAPGALPGAPPGLRTPASITLGVMSDGNDVPMAWAVLVVDREAREAARNGALEAGLADVAVAGSSGSAMAGHEAAVGAARGTAVPAGALFATADLAISYEEGVVYRRQQPGRPWASRMETDLDLGTNDMEGALGFEAVGAVTSGNGVARAGGSVEGDAQSFSLTAGSAEAGEVEAATMAASGHSALGSARVGSAVNANRVIASGRVDAGSLATAGPVVADLLVVGGALDAVNVPGASPPEGGSVTSAAGMVGRDLQVTGTLDVGPATAVSMDVGTLSSNGLTASGMTVTGAVFGPSGRVTGTLRVGSCDGC